MTNTNIDLAVSYYTEMNNKDLDAIAQYLHPDVHFIGLMGQTHGKEALLEAAKGFMDFFKTLTIRTKFGSDNQAMLAYDLECPEPIGVLRAAALFTFGDGLITKLELFCDASKMKG